MLEQVAQESVRQAPNLTPIYALLGPLALKAIADVGVQLVKARQERARAKAAEAEADLEEAKAYGISLLKSKNGVPDKPTIVAFCPAHIDVVKEQAAQGVELKHINATVTEIKGHVEFIRGKVG